MDRTIHTQFYPGNIGSYDPYINPILGIVDRTIQYLLIILKTFFNGGPGGRRAGGVGGRGSGAAEPLWGFKGAEIPGGRGGCNKRTAGHLASILLHCQSIWCNGFLKRLGSD